MKPSSFGYMRFIAIYCLIFQASCSCKFKEQRLQGHKDQVTPVENRARNIERVITFEEAKTRPFTKIPESLKLAFMAQKITMIRGESISPLNLADLMEERFSKKSLIRVCFIEIDKSDLSELTRCYDLSEYRKEWREYFPDENGLFNPFSLMKFLLPWHSFFFSGDTLMISKIVGG